MGILRQPVGDLARKAWEAGSKEAGAVGRAMTRRRLLKAGAGIAGLIAAGAVPYLYLNRTRHPSRQHNVILIVSDSMRADKIGKVVKGMEVTPNLNRFAAEAAIFTNAFASSTWTKASVASILCGEFPQFHGVRSPSDAMPDVGSMPAFFLDKEYFPFGLVTNPVLQGEPSGDGPPVPYGYAYPFLKRNRSALDSLKSARGVYAYLPPLPTDRYARDGYTEGYRDTADLFAAFWTVVARAGRIRRGHGFFAYLHDMRTHLPWLPSAPVEGVTGRFHDSAESLAQTHEDDLTLAIQYTRKTRNVVPPEPAQARLRAINDEAAFLFDLHFGRFLDRLKSEGIYDTATVVFTSDHGDEFYEHGALGHAKNLYNASLRVPLIIKRPGATPLVVTDVATNASIYPTLADFFGAPLYNSNVLSLAHHFAGPAGAGDSRQNVLAALWGQQKLIASDGRVVIRDGAGARQFFHLAADPDERLPLEVDSGLTDVFERESRFCLASAAIQRVKSPQTMVPELMVFRNVNRDGTFAASPDGLKGLSKTSREQLRTLGYLQ